MVNVQNTSGFSSGQDDFLKIIKFGNLVYLSSSVDGKAPTSARLVEKLQELLSYRHRKLLFGQEAFTDEWGKKHKVEVSHRRIYGFDAGRLVTSFGFVKTIIETAQSLSMQIAYCDIDRANESTKPHARPDRYETSWKNVERCFKFRAKQRECLQAIEQSPWGLVDATMGFGKMAMIAMVCLLFNKAKIHIVTKRCPIVIKICNYLTEYLPNVGQIGCGGRSKGDRITVFSCDSFERSDFDADILMIDEVHEPVTDAYLPIFARYGDARRYGFTGTSSGRTDGADLRIEAVVGPTIFKLTYQEAEALGLVVPITVERVDVELPRNPTSLCRDDERLKYGIWFNHERNDIVAEDILKAPEDEQKLALTRTIYHAAELYKRVKDKGDFTLIYDSVDLGRYRNLVRDGVLPVEIPRMTPSIKNNHLKRFESGKGNYIATTTWEVGIDPTYLQHLFVVDSFSSEIKASQGPARTSRLNSKIGKACGFVHDYRDKFDASFYEASRARFRVYSGLGWTQVLKQGDSTISLK